MSQVIQVTRDKSSGKIEDIKFFKEFYDDDLGMQLLHLKHFLEVVGITSGGVKLIEHDSEPSNEPTD